MIAAVLALAFAALSFWLGYRFGYHFALRDVGDMFTEDTDPNVRIAGREIHKHLDESEKP